MNYFDVINEEHDIFKHEGIEKLGNALMQEFGLKELGWTFRISRTKTALGRCFHSEKVIEFSEYFDHVSWEQIEETIRHEIAHALVGPQHGHDHAWRVMAIRCGARPERTADERANAKWNYKILCANRCGWHCTRFRLDRKAAQYWRCPQCHSDIQIYKRKEGK